MAYKLRYASDLLPSYFNCKQMNDLVAQHAGDYAELLNTSSRGLVLVPKGLLAKHQELFAAAASQQLGTKAAARAERAAAAAAAAAGEQQGAAGGEKAGQDAKPKAAGGGHLSAAVLLLALAARAFARLCSWSGPGRPGPLLGAGRLAQRTAPSACQASQPARRSSRQRRGGITAPQVRRARAQTSRACTRRPCRSSATCAPT
jgi:hypothetical protein